MNIGHDEYVWLAVVADRKATWEEARVRLAPLKVPPPTKVELRAMKRAAKGRA